MRRLMLTTTRKQRVGVFCFILRPCCYAEKALVGAAIWMHGIMVFRRRCSGASLLGVRKRALFSEMELHSLIYRN